jgi:hypothetical protein
MKNLEPFLYRDINDCLVGCYHLYDIVFADYISLFGIQTLFDRYINMERKRHV